MRLGKKCTTIVGAFVFYDLFKIIIFEKKYGYVKARIER